MIDTAILRAEMFKVLTRKECKFSTRNQRRVEIERPDNCANCRLIAAGIDIIPHTSVQ
jgi:hypothetical protein